MKSVQIILAVLIVGLVVLGLNSIGHTQQAGRQASTVQIPTFEYATLRTQSSNEQNNSAFILIWNQGVNDVIGRSNRSLVDARRKMNAQLGGVNTSRTNLSVLLNTIGSNGWRLVETTENEQGTSRIFIRSGQTR